VGGNLPAQQTLETIFESDCQSPAVLFVFNFADADDFHRAEALINSIKKNFKGYLYGQFGAVPSRQLLEHAYAAGLDYVDIPLIGWGVFFCIIFAITMFILLYLNPKVTSKHTY
jgi:hypothetical protein